MVTYREVEETIMVKKPTTRLVDQHREKNIITYETRTATRPIQVPKVRLNTENKTFTNTLYRYNHTAANINTTEQAFVPKNFTKPESLHMQIPKVTLVREEVLVADPYQDIVVEPFTVTIPVTTLVPETFSVTEMQSTVVTRQRVESVPYVEDVTHNYTVMVPTTETIQGSHCIPRRVPVTTYQTQCVDQGEWQTVTKTLPAGPCETNCSSGLCQRQCPTPQTVTQRVWVPRLVTHQTPCTTYQIVNETVPYSYTVTKMKPETRSVTYPVVRYRNENRSYEEVEYKPQVVTRTRQVEKTEFRTETRSRERYVTKYRMVPQEKLTPKMVYETKATDYNSFYTQVVPESQNVPQVDYQSKLIKIPYETTIQEITPVVVWETVEEEYEVTVPVITPVQYTVQVPEIVYEDVPRRVTRSIPEIENVTYTVNVPQKRSRATWKTEVRQVPEIKTLDYTVNVPHQRKRTIMQTRYRQVPEVKQETYTIMVPVVRTKTEIEYRDETIPIVKSQTITVQVPQVQTRTVYRTQQRTVMEQQMQTYEVSVPYQVPVQTLRRVCQMVPKQIKVSVGGSCSSCVPSADGFDSYWNLPANGNGAATETPPGGPTVVRPMEEILPPPMPDQFTGPNQRDDATPPRPGPR